MGGGGEALVEGFGRGGRQRSAVPAAGTGALRRGTRGARARVRGDRAEPGRGRRGGGGGEAPDRRAEGVMSCPAGEALPQHPRPRPRRWGRGRGAARRGPALGDPGRGPRAAPATPPPCCVHSFARGWWAPEPRGSGRRAGAPGPRPAPARPAPRRLPPLSRAARGRAPAGEAPSRGCVLACCSLGRQTQRPDRAPRAPRAAAAAAGFCCLRLLGRRRLRTASPARGTLALSFAGGGAAPAPPWSSGPEAGGCCVRPPRWPFAPAGTLPARAGAAAKSARSTGPRASA